MNTFEPVSEASSGLPGHGYWLPVEIGRYLQPLATLLMVAAAVAIYRQPHFIWSTPALWIVLVALLAVSLSRGRLPIFALLFYLAGAASFIWSLTPANTLLNSLWELVYLAALAVGGSITGFALVNASLTYAGLESTLLLDLFGLTEYFSGSAHYLAGAQALLFLPMTLATAVCSRRWSNRLAAVLAAAACLLLILNSGARAVYLPAAFMLPLVLFRLGIPRRQRVRAVLMPALALAIVLAVAAVLPGPTVEFPLRTKAVTVDLQRRPPASAAAAVPSDRVSGVGEEGAVASRLKMWDQTINIGLSHPFGTGAGSFRDTIHAFQRYPLVGFSSAHNVFLEVFSTGGWLRLILLVALLASCLSPAWNSPRWPLALGAAGIWATMSFDITGQMPAIMTLGFWSLGASLPPRPRHPDGPPGLPLFGRGAFDTSEGRSRVLVPLTSAVLFVASVVTLWWYLPCEGIDCVTGRHLANRSEVLRISQGADDSELSQLAQSAIARNPRSLWAWRFHAELATTPGDRLATSREVATRFPLASPDSYLRWADAAIALGDASEARRAVLAGLEVFPPDFNPAGVPFGGRAVGHDRWLANARRILDEAEAIPSTRTQ